MPTEPRYRERLDAPTGWWLIGLAGLVTVWVITAVPAGTLTATVVTAVATVLVVGVLVGYGAAEVSVDAEVLRAGRASIERRYLGEVVPLKGDEARAASGRDADHRAHLLLRPYVHGAVRIQVNDPDDPTPYWLIATRHPDELAAALA